MLNGEQLPKRLARGFSLLLILVLISVVGMFSAWTVSVGHAASRQQAEAELLAIGSEFRAALISYRAGAAPSENAGPTDLQDLLRDPRVPGVRRHLRKIYADPLTGNPQWGLLRAANGRIIGVHSLAPGTPLKQAGFEPEFSGFHEAKSYSQWLFSAQPLVRAPVRTPSESRTETPR